MVFQDCYNSFEIFKKKRGKINEFIEIFLQILELLQENSSLKETSENVIVKDEKELEEASTCDDFSNEDIASLASILDRTEGWKKLAEKTGLGILVPVLSKGKSSPSLTILSYINVSVN